MQTDEYLKLAEVEDRMWYFRALHAHAADALRGGLASGAPAGGILDAGCGTGGFIKRVMADFPGRPFTGIDFSALACDLARRRCPARIEEASITALPFADGEFAAVVSLDVLVQVHEREQALAEFYRVLKPGGVAVINVAAYKWLWSYHDESCQTRHRYTRPELAGQLCATGFDVGRVTHWNLLPLPLIVAKRKLFTSRADTSDVKLYPAPVEAAFNLAMAGERAWLRQVGPLPAGCSVLAVARKPEGGAARA